MSLQNFICPDGGKISIEKCLAPGGCRMSDRCSTRPYLIMCATERPQRFRCKNGHKIKLPASNKNFNLRCPKKIEASSYGRCGENLNYIPSTTQLIAGTKQAFLRLTSDYDISPDSRAFMIIGTKGHFALESYNDEYSLIEEKFEDGESMGIADLLTSEDGENVLTDNKTSGSYKVAKALGLETTDEPTGETYKTGKRKGEQKTRKVVRRNAESIDRKDWEWQMNDYRMKFEHNGFMIDRLKIFCIVRDGNTYIARSRGIFRNVYYFEINKIPDEQVREFFGRKQKNLLQALSRGFWDEVCSREECWDGLKCASYCEVADNCPQGKYLKREKIKEVDIMPIKGLSETRRLPRMGKIRLGIMKKSQETGKDYPAEVKHFILDPAVANPEEKQKLIDIWGKRYGKEPTSIDIMFPVSDLEHVFPQYYKSYGSATLLKCKGDGSHAETNDPKYIERLEVVGDGDFGKIVKCAGRECPYFLEKQCSEVATLSVLLPELPGSGVWQVSTGSIHSILNLNSCFDYIAAIAGRFHMIPLKLERREQEIQHEGKKTRHYVLHINLELALKDLQRRALVDPVKAAMELPPIADEAKDLYLEHNPTVNPNEYKEPAEDAEIVEQPKQDLTNGGGAEKGWDDEPSPEQADLRLQVEASIQVCESIEALQFVKKKYEPHFKKDSTSLTVKQRDELNGVYKSRSAEIKRTKNGCPVGMDRCLVCGWRGDHKVARCPNCSKSFTD